MSHARGTHPNHERSIRAIDTELLKYLLLGSSDHKFVFKDENTISFRQFKRFKQCIEFVNAIIT